MRYAGNPAERSGVKVYHPRKLPNISFDTKTNLLTDLDTGNRLFVRPGHAGGAGKFGLSKQKTGPIAGGGYTFWSDQDLKVYEITSLMSAQPGLPYLARSEFDISALAELFRARYDMRSPNHRGTVLVVDSRPEMPADLNQRSPGTK
jgi:hypothetical protein